MKRAVGASLPLGGKWTSARPEGQAARVTGNVRRVLRPLRNEGPWRAGTGRHGSSAVLDTGKVEIAVISRLVEPHDIAAFRVLGIEPENKRYLMLKSRVHWRAGLGPIARAVIECAGEGVCTSDYSTLNFRRVRRPVFPLDPA
jgi:microcystin degradation protein MlrC